MKELMGGCWLGALIAGALGILSIAITMGLFGTLAAIIGLVYEAQQTRKATSWRAQYPTYKY